MSNLYHQIQEQREKRDLLQQEIEGEERYLHVLSVSYKDTCRSYIGKEESRSIASQINRWVDSMDQEKKRSTLLFINLDDAFEQFREYVINKYEGNSNKLGKFQELFDNQEYVNDCKRILIHKIYDFKLDESLKNFDNGFVSPRAHSVAAFNQQLKEVRKSAHEGMYKAYSSLNGPHLPDDVEGMLYSIFENVVAKNMAGAFKDYEKRLRLVKNKGKLLN